MTCLNFYKKLKFYTFCILSYKKIAKKTKDKNYLYTNTKSIYKKYSNIQ